MKQWFYINSIEEYNEYMADIMGYFDCVWNAHKERLEKIDKEETQRKAEMRAMYG